MIKAILFMELEIFYRYDNDKEVEFKLYYI